MRTFPLCLGVLLLFASQAAAATVSGASCTMAAVQSAIDSANTGDTVAVPAGNCTWNASVSIPSTKKIILQGAGIGTTVLAGNGDIGLALNQSGSRVTGFTFNQFGIVVDGDDWRIDHNRFIANEDFFTSIQVQGEREFTHPRGLIDNNSFEGGARVIVNGWNGLLAHGLWSQPLGLGGSQTVFVESNTFSKSNPSGNAIDTNYGGRYVFRHNTVTNLYIEMHSVQGPDHRATRSWEVYNNTFHTTAGFWTVAFIRGGTGVFFGNTATGPWSNVVVIDNVRSERDVGSPARRCDGTSGWDGNQQGNGWPCRDMIGRGSDAFLWTGGESCPVGGCPSQASEPAYFWNNQPNEIVVDSASAHHIVAGRDFVSGAPRPGYIPYPYPHPLTQGGGAPPAPTNLTVR